MVEDTQQQLSSNVDFIKGIATGGPYQASVVIKANPRYASTVSNRLEPYKNMPAKFQPVMEAVADYMRHTAIPGVFSVEGPGWRGLSRRTQFERQAQGYNPKHPILRRSGDLFRELTDKAHPKHVEIIRTGVDTRLVLGGSSEKFIRNQLGNSLIHIPRRPMIPGTGWLKLHSSDVQAMQQIVNQKIREIMKHGSS